MGSVLITGGAGFIGLALARYCASRGDEVILVATLFKNAGKHAADLTGVLEGDRVTFLEADMTSPMDDVPLPSRLDIVYHLAAINGTRLFYEMPYEVARTNLLVTLSLLQRLETINIGRLVYTSTSEVYSGCEQLDLLKIPTDESVPVAFPQPTDRRYSYATSKFAGEFLCLHWGSHRAVPTSVIRYHNVYGPRMGQKHVIPEFIVRASSGEDPFTIYGGVETRAFCYVDDAVEATCLVGECANADQEIVHVGNAREEIAIRDLAQLVTKRLGKFPTFVEGGRRSSSVLRRCPDVSKLDKLTGFKARVMLDEGLTRTIPFYANR